MSRAGGIPVLHGGEDVNASWGGLALIRCGGGQDELTRRTALEAAYGAEFREVGSGLDGEYVGHIPSVRLSSGPRGVRSVTVHAPSWGEVLDTLEGILDFPPGAGSDAPRREPPGGSRPRGGG